MLQFALRSRAVTVTKSPKNLGDGDFGGEFRDNMGVIRKLIQSILIYERRTARSATLQLIKHEQNAVYTSGQQTQENRTSH